MTLEDPQDIGTSKDPTVKDPVETKVAAATGGAGIGAVLGALLVYLLDELVYRPGSDLGDDVPLVVVTAVTVLLGALGAFFAGWRAPHTPRALQEAAVGVPGPPGPQGATGPMGPKGDQGERGPAGRDATGADSGLKTGYLGEPHQTGDPVADDSLNHPGGMG